MARMMLESVVPAILSLILGPFSDRFGRKLILNSTSLGLTLYFASLCVLKYLTPYLPISPWYYALSVLFFSLSGGFSVILTGVLSHTTDSSTERNRSERFVTNSLWKIHLLSLRNFFQNHHHRIDDFRWSTAWNIYQLLFGYGDDNIPHFSDIVHLHYDINNLHNFLYRGDCYSYTGKPKFARLCMYSLYL